MSSSTFSNYAGTGVVTKIKRRQFVPKWCKMAQRGWEPTEIAAVLYDSTSSAHWILQVCSIWLLAFPVTSQNGTSVRLCAASRLVLNVCELLLIATSALLRIFGNSIMNSIVCIWRLCRPDTMNLLNWVLMNSWNLMLKNQTHLLTQKDVAVCLGKCPARFSNHCTVQTLGL